MKLTAITVEATGDWARMIVEDNDNVFLAPPNNPLNNLSYKHVDKLQLERNENNDVEIGIWMSLEAHDPVIVHGYVASDQPFINLKLGHGENGWIRVSSPIDSVTNAINSGDGQNFIPVQLALTAPANNKPSPILEREVVESTR